MKGCGDVANVPRCDNRDSDALARSASRTADLSQPGAAACDQLGPGRLRVACGYGRRKSMRGACI